MRSRRFVLRGLSGVASSVLLFLILSSGIRAAVQPSGQSQDEEGVLRVDAQLVLVDVVARRGNRPASDLTKDDFTVLDEGVLQDIDVFEVNSAVSEAESSPLPAGVASNMRDWQGASPRAATVVLIDRLNTPDQDQVSVNQHLEQFFSSFEDLGHVALYELTEELTPIHDFTRVPEELVQVASELHPYHSVTLASSDSDAGFEGALGTVGVDRDLGDFLSGATGRGQFGRQSADYFLDTRIQKTLEALEAIAHHLSGIPGRKNLVWLSGRFPFTFDPWNRTDLVEEVDRSTVAWMEQVGFQLTRSNIAVYPVDVRGPATEGTAEFNGVMKTVADMTGGRPFYGTNSAGDAITQAVEDAQVVYTLGFYPSEPGENGDFHDIEVRVSSDDVDLHYRPGYFAFAGQNSTELTWGLTEFLTSPLDATDITLVGRASPISATTQESQLLILADTADLDLRPENGARVGEINLVGIFEAADTGAVTLIPAETIPISLSDEQYQQALSTGFLLQKKLATTGPGRVRLVVRDTRTGEAGSVWLPVSAE